MPSFSTARVTSVHSQRKGLQRVQLDSGRGAYVLTQLIGSVAVGDRVVVNTTAVDLGLGTGGWDVVHWNLERDKWSRPGRGHVMKLRYTSLQADTGAEEEASAYRPGDSLGGMPVVVCGLHSQVAAVAATFKHAAPDRRLAYVMTDAGALPIAVSDLVADLCAAGLIDTTVTAGQAFGGDHEAVNALSGLEICQTVAGADAVVVGTGPGVVGTGTRHGSSALEVAALIDLAGRAGGRPMVALRYSSIDPRPRHQGISQQSHAALSLAHERTLVAVPSGQPMSRFEGHEVIEVQAPDVPTLLSVRGLAVTTMGRTAAQDPLFFAYAGAAGVLAASVLSPP